MILLHPCGGHKLGPDDFLHFGGNLGRFKNIVQANFNGVDNVAYIEHALRGSDVRTACQQACPTNAIVFGSLSEPDSEMMRNRAQPRSYSVLHDLGTEPRVRYLARIRNRNEDIDA